MMNNLKYFILSVLAIILLAPFTGCTDFIDASPDKKLAIPYTGKDLQAILDNVARINDTDLGLSEIAADNFFLPAANWSAIEEIENRESYVWKRTPVAELYWTYMYRKIYEVNTVLDHINKVTYQSEAEKRQIYGTARLVRGMAFHKLAEVFTLPFDSNKANENRLGLVLKLSSDINEPVSRTTIGLTHKQIMEDIKTAIDYLPLSIAEYPTRPSKVSAYGAMARYLLSIRDYPRAGLYADSCLRIKSDLLDYNLLVENPYPFDLYNNEVIYHSRSYPYRNLSEANARVDTVLFDLYEPNDLRKKLFYTRQLDGYYSFTGDYSKSNFEKFNGITTAEMYLIRSESKARSGQYTAAVEDLYTLLKRRYLHGFALSDLNTPLEHQSVIGRILSERRKELIGRGLRWSDIRRLSLEEGNDILLRRKLYEDEYILGAKDIREFCFLIPTVVIERGGYEQN